MNFTGFVEYVREKGWTLYGISVCRDGRRIHSYYIDEAGAGRRHPIYSATKAVTSLAAGLGIQEGKLAQEDSIYEYLGSEVPVYVSEEQRARLKQITLRRLLAMSVQGWPFRPEGENWLEYALTFPLGDIETPAFSYSNIPAYLAGVAVEKAVGEHLYTYLNKRIFTPLEIWKPIYQNCPSGHFYGASGMELSVEELEKIGRLFLQEGNWQGQQLVSPEYIREAVSIQQSNREGGYGYYIWYYPDGYYLSGKWGQRCLVLPKQKLTITYLSHMEQDSDVLMAAVERFLLDKVMNC